ncbi:cycloheximide resistance protein [Diplodia corticola]|uniref:Cycloheximide resistance protein n=1 Tax=Diplodia corticola TaxID=236234 RepID=A0A1J9QNI6_9PEZI|nr:cycloheximide resistance protein [Diplodia corticola]OJD30017.1 cycloheximide resistance protein [Diplodia corticola]
MSSHGQASAEIEKISSPADFEKLARDADLFGWWTPDEPELPRNWTKSTRLAHVGIASASAFLASLTSTAFAPAGQSLHAEYGVTNATIATLTVTIYLLGFALGPLVIAPLSETYGRCPAYLACLLTSVCFLVACSQATGVAQFLVFRFITGVAGSGPAVIGAATIADLIPKEERGAAMAVFSAGPLLGLVIGPLTCAFIAQHLSWRWVFRVLYIATAAVFIPAFFFMRETYTPVVILRKVAAVRKKTGNPTLYSEFDSHDSAVRTWRHAIVRPTKMLIFSPICLLLSIYCAFVWGLLFLLFTTFPAVWSKQYGWTQGISGLSYLGMGVGMAVGGVGYGLITDRVVERDSKAQGKPWSPEGRLLPMVWCAPVLPAGFFCYGWSAYYKAHWIIPILGTTAVGFGALLIMMPVQIYLVDSFGPKTAASALAANTVLRALAGCFLPLAGPALYASLGLGWGNTLLGFIGLFFCALPIFFYRYGESIRKKYHIEF